MEIEANNILGSVNESIDRLSAAAALLEKTALLLEQREAERHGDLQKIVATAAEPNLETTAREQELERRLAAAEQQLTELRAQEEKPASLRKTLPAATVQLLAKGGITALESIEAGALDAALTGLSLEQRIAVKSQLLRAGVTA